MMQKRVSFSNWSDLNAPDVVITTSQLVNVNFPGGTEQLSVNADTIIYTMQKFSSKILKRFKLGEKLTSKRHLLITVDGGQKKS